MKRLSSLACVWLSGPLAVGAAACLDPMRGVHYRKAIMRVGTP
eukprot:COSAG04_NODE_22264_length_358_cov_0.517375_1_plen_42_part_10